MPTENFERSQGDVRGDDIFDTTAIKARQRLAAGMYNWMAPPEQRWFELQPSDKELAKDDKIKSNSNS